MHHLFRLPYGLGRAIRNLTLALLVGGSALPATADQVIAALGDSLTAGYGLPDGEGLAPQLQAWLAAQGREVTVVNAGVSGDTTAGGLSRLDWTLAPEVKALIVALGGNDMLRGLPPEASRANLEAILKGAKAKGIPVLLVAMQAPANLGPDYQKAFDAIYPELAAEYQVLFNPGFYAPLLGNPPDPAKLGPFLQADGLHPTAEGVTKIVEGLGPDVLKLLDQIQ
ncbi:arylesterase [Stagnihabitans tardus]|uniref:Arylesterase n=1 Tax=Stagnihabitans tardus TaxID=2699202 RepID=A0AAE4YDM0_9RHOB|nr:arylesterase [Stagnihabitans tardus]NBZ89732.1 arylesterase [Stagnihabitans tardus]